MIGLISAILLVVVITRRSAIGLSLYKYPWLLSLLLILNPINSMPPLTKMWWMPIVLLVFVAHIAQLEHRSLISLRGTKLKLN